MSELIISPSVLESVAQRHASNYSLEDSWKMYAPPRTWGATEEHQLAMDEHLQSCGYSSLIQHAIGLGMGFAEIAPQFLGYPYLAGLSQNPLIRAGVTTTADDMTKRWIEIKRDGKRVENDEKISAITAAIESFGLQTIFNEAAQKADFDGGCLVYIDTGEEGEDLEKPLALVGGRQIKHFTLVEAINLYPGLYNAYDPLARDYFKPEKWLVLGRPIHRSRFLYFAPNQLPVILRPAYNFFGIPIAQQVLDYVAHFTKTREAAQRMLTKFSTTVVKTDMSQILSGGDANNFDRRMQFFTQYRDNDMVLAIDKEREDIIKLETPLSGVIDVPRQALEFVSMIFRMPVTKFLGISPAGMNATGESDQRNYLDHIESKQSKMLRRPIDKVIDVIQMHLYGEIDPGIKAHFAPLSDEDDSAKALTKKTEADTLAVLVQSEIISQEEARRVLANDAESNLAFIDPEEIPSAPGGSGMEEFDESLASGEGYGAAADQDGPLSFEQVG